MGFHPEIHVRTSRATAQDAERVIHRLSIVGSRKHLDHVDVMHDVGNAVVGTVASAVGHRAVG